MNEELFENLRLELRRGCLILAVLAQLRSEQYGYTLVKNSKVVEAAAPDDAKRKSTAEQIRQAAAQDELVAMIKSLRAKADVDISQTALEQKADAQ